MNRLDEIKAKDQRLVDAGIRYNMKVQLNDSEEDRRWLLARVDELAAVVRDAVDQGMHPDGCPWWNTPAKDLSSERGRERADADCDCFLKQGAAALSSLSAPAPEEEPK